MSDPKTAPKSESLPAISKETLRAIFWLSVQADKPLPENSLRELAKAAAADADRFVAQHDDLFKMAHEDDDKPFAVVDIPDLGR